MHLHNVADFAPPGYRLERSDMGTGGCQHRFVADGKPELVCEGSWASAEEERLALNGFRIKHTVAALPDDAPELQSFREYYRQPSENLVSEAAVRAGLGGVLAKRDVTLPPPTDQAATTASKPKASLKKR